jgi:hypothetical protein
MLHIASGFTVHKLERLWDISLVLGMLLATVNVAKSAPKLPKISKICPKIINLRNLEMPPKLEIYFSKK